MVSKATRRANSSSGVYVGPRVLVIAGRRSSVHAPPRIRAVERECRNSHIEQLAGLIRHLIAADHDALRRLQWAARCVMKRLAGLDHRRLPDDAGAANFLGASITVGDAP